MVPDYNVEYYYRSLQEKFEEVMSVNNCSVSATTGEKLGFEPLPGQHPDLEVRVVTPPEAITRRWGTVGKELYNSTKATFRTNENLCKSKPFYSFTHGGYKDAKGCGQMIQNDKAGKSFKIIKRRGATLHPEHIRCKSHRASDTCMDAAKRAVPLDPDLRSLHNYPFMITAKQAVVSRGGQLSLPCGYVSLFASCEAWGWGMMNVTASIPKQAPQLCRDSDRPGAENNCPFPVHDRVFIVASYDDTQIGQFIQEALPKLVYHLDFILANPDIKLHYGFTKQLHLLPNFVLPHLIFDWLGVGDRLINGTVYAKTVYMPREGGCQDVGYNAWELLTTRELFMTKAGIDQDDHSQQRSVVVIRRSASPYTKNQGDYRQRRWPKAELQTMLEQLKIIFPQHRLDIYSDVDKNLMKCRACQIKMFADADVVIAAHGAGMTNTMFMRPGGLIMEIVTAFDSRHAPLVGIFPRLSGIVGLHHYTYYLDNMKIFKAVDLLKETESYAKEVGIRGVGSAHW